MKQKLLSTYTPNIDESMDDFKLRHGQYANWARYLRESCQVFGKAITEQDTFYYSINSDSSVFKYLLCMSFFSADMFIKPNNFIPNKKRIQDSVD